MADQLLRKTASEKARQSSRCHGEDGGDHHHRDDGPQHPAGGSSPDHVDNNEGCGKDNSRDYPGRHQAGLASNAQGDELYSSAELTLRYRQEYSLFLETVAVILLVLLAAPAAFAETFYTALLSSSSLLLAFAGAERLLKRWPGIGATPYRHIAFLGRAPGPEFIERDRFVITLIAVVIAPALEGTAAVTAMVVLGLYAGTGCALTVLREAVRFFEGARP